MRRFASICLLVALAAPLFAFADPGGETAMFRGDAALSGVRAVSPPRSLKGVRFRFQAEAPIRSTPALAAGKLLFGSDDGNFYAIDAMTGVERWRFRAGGGISSSAAVARGVAYFTAWDGALYAVSVATGRLRWKIAFGPDLGIQNYWDFYTSSPTLAGGMLYVGSGDGHVYAIDPASGRKAWQYDAGARVRATPAVSGDFVVFGTMDGHVHAIDRRTGARRWRFATEGASHTYETKRNDTTSVVTPPSIGGGIVTVGARDGFMYGLDLATGAQRWKITHDGASWILTTAVQGDRVYSGSGSAFFIQSAALATGVEQWRFATPAAVFSPVALAGGVLVATDLTGDIHALNAADGTELWRFPLGERAFGGVLLGEGVVYAAADNGMLYALDTDTAAASPPVRRIVYAEGKATPEAAGWFPEEINVGILGAFRNAGYEKLTQEGLVGAVREQIEKKAASVIVFADQHVPAALADGTNGPPLLRRYLDAGGVVVFLGMNPLAFQFDPKTGTLAKIDEGPGGVPLGLAYPPRPESTGHHVSRYTAEGERFGLSGYFVTSGTVRSDHMTILAQDRLGMPTSWIKAYGERGMLLQFAPPRIRMIDMTPFRAAIEVALSQRARLTAMP